ncbi:MAG TPA: hypothetical protein VNS46_08565 [Nocardioides sp.]|nr:hypothetical protein [Nocardioides sp.]
MGWTVASPRVAWGLCVLALVLVPTGPVMFAVAGPRPAALLFALSFAAVQISTAVVGAIVASRLPTNAVGWILVGMGAGLGISDTATAYGRCSTRLSEDPLPGEAIAYWLGNWTLIPLVFGGVALLVYVFPDGRFVSRRWRLAAQLSAVVVLVATLTDAFGPGKLEDAPALDNPFGTSGRVGDLVVKAGMVADVGALPVFGLAAAALVVRYRRSRGVERQQLKWISSALLLVAVSLGLAAGVPALGDTTFFVALFSLAAMPVMTGIAVLRYRLYDIDVVINRALVYATLTATLAAFYIGAVLLLQVVLRPFTAGSSLAIAVSTLAVAALFRPVRARIQDAVDRRFFRHRYDAALTLESFGARIRDQVELTGIGNDLLGVVNETVQPRHLSLWLAGPEGPR